MKIKQYSIILCAILIFALTAFGAEDARRPVAEVMYDSSGISFMPVVSYGIMSMTVSCPNGEVIEKRFTSGQSPYLSLADLGDNFTDGSYTYELRTFPGVTPRGDVDRKKATAASLSQSFTQAGYFLVRDGAIINGNLTEQPNLASATDTSGNGISRVQDVVHLDDTIIQGSLCVGFDCQNGESFGFDTLRLKENNLRIHFQDTSSTASFPTRDWRIVINDSGNGGANYFAVQDSDSARNVFVVEAGAPANALYVEDYGRVGLGTSTPVVELHVKDSDTPTLRLEQDSSGGWSPQTWDVAGNESNFFIRDATNGSKLSFRIQPGTPSSTLCLKSNGKVGIGTWSPSYTLEVQTTNTGAKIVANRTDGAIMEMSASSSNGIAGTKSDHPLQLRVKDIMIMELNGSDDYVTMIGGGTYNGTWNPSSSRELKENIQDLSLDEAMNALVELNPVKYNYKTQKEEPRVGFIAEDVPELVAMKGKKTLGTVDVVAVLTKVVQEQQKLAKQQQSTIEELKNKIRDLEEKLDR